MKQGRGSGTWWGPLFGARAETWAETWEGPQGWGTPVYAYVLDHAHSSTVPECGLGIEPTSRGTLAVGAGGEFRSRVLDVARSGHGRLRTRGAVTI